MEFLAAFTKKKISLSFLIFGISFYSYCQVNTTDILARSKSTNALKSKGIKAFDDGDYLLAQIYIEALINRKPDNPKYQLLLGKIFLKNKLYQEAEKRFLSCKDKAATAPFYLAYSQVALGKYKEAKINFDAFKKANKKNASEEDEVIYKSLQATFKNKWYDQKDSLPAPSIVRLNNLANGKLAEFSPFYLTDSTFFFGKTTPDETQFFLKTDSQTSAIPYRKYFEGEINKTGEVKSVAPWQMNQQDSLQNYGGACFNTTKTVMYLTLCERKMNVLECHIYQSKRSKEGWSKPIMLDSKINAQGYTSAQPSLGYDSAKKTEVLYFSSNMPGARGFDIYYAQYDKTKRTFSNASRCGIKINTALDEYTPFYSSSNSILYFSSNGKGGYGGQDIFKSKGSMNLWNDAVPLPTPINSAADDDYFSIDNQNKRGFFASNRNSESSTSVKTCCDDIYAFYLENQSQTTPIKTKETALVLVPLKLNFEEGDFVKDANKFVVYELNQGNKIPIYSSQKTTLDTTLLLTADKVYKLTATSKSHLTESKEVDLKKFTSIDTLYFYPKLIPKKAIVIPGINYEFDSSRLIPESIEKIEEFIYPLLIENPTLIFQINSHTDSKGNDDYNLQLSQRRAASVVQYLTTVRDIAPSRLRSMGFGETKPIAPNTFADGKDNPVGRALNRRTEFEVVGGVEQFLK